jgi:hypothetical protein
MVVVPKMLGGVFVLGGIATAHLAAYHAQAQVNPGVADFDAFFADMFIGGFDLDLIQMLALG